MKKRSRTRPTWLFRQFFLTLPVDLVELLGVDSIVHGRLPAGVSTLASGASLLIELPASVQHLFDRASGKRIESSR